MTHLAAVVVALVALGLTGCSRQEMGKGIGKGTAGRGDASSVGGFGGGGDSSLGGSIGGDGGINSSDGLGGAAGAGGEAGAGAAAGAGGGAGAGAAAGGAAGAGEGGNSGVAGATGFVWRTLPSLAKKRQNGMGAVVGETMFVIGGYDERGLLADVERLDPGEARWTIAPPLPMPQCCAAAGALGSVIAVAGGYGPDGHTPTNTLFLFDTASEVWRSGPPMPTARANAMGAVWNGKLVVIGGGTQYGAPSAAGVIEIYDLESNMWVTSPLTVTPRTAGVAIVDSGRIYLIGGFLQNSLYGDALTEIVSTNAVDLGPPLAVARGQVAGGLLPSGLAIAGGWTASSDTPRAEALIGTRAAWQSLPPMPTSRAGAVAAVVNGSLIVAGGGQYQGMWVQQNVVEALQMSPAQP